MTKYKDPDDEYKKIKKSDDELQFINAVYRLSELQRKFKADPSSMGEKIVCLVEEELKKYEGI